MGHDRVSLIELLDADFGVGLNGAYVTQWRGRRGNVARPITADMTVDTTALGGRKALFFNGTTQGLLLEIPELRRNCSILAIHVHMKSVWSATSQVAVSVPLDDATGHRVLGIGYASSGAVLCSSNAGTEIGTTFTWTTNEMVICGVRDRATRIEAFVNGSTTGQIGSSALSPQPAVTTVSIGVDSSPTPDVFFSGVIRRIAIFSIAHDDADAAAIDSQWRGK